jgi:hypothetical protein
MPTAGAPMTLALKPIQANDYDVIHDGEIIGRIYRTIGGEDLWRWMMAGPREPTEGPSGGICTSLDHAKAALQAEWEVNG